MTKKALKTKDRKAIIRRLKVKLRLAEKLNRKYYEQFQLADDDKSKALWFIRCYGNYIMKHGCDEDKKEFKRMMKTIGGDDKRWL